MDGGVIEFELRSLPGVIAASVHEAGVALLVLPDVDADALRVVAAAILAAHGVETTVQVLGGRSSPAAENRSRRVAVGTIGALGGLGLLAGAAGVAAMTGVLPYGSDAMPPAATTAAATAAPQPSAASRSATDLTVVPGKQPTWAADEGAWPLPAVLPAATVAVPALVVTNEAVPAPVDPMPLQRKIDPPPARVPAALSGSGPTTPTSVDTPQPEIGTPGADADEDTTAAPGGADRQHFGWTNGPDHASPRSSAADAPRGGRR